MTQRLYTYNSTADAVDEDGFTGCEVGELEQEYVSHGVVHGYGCGVVVAHAFGDHVDRGRGYRHVLGPGLVVGKCDDFVANLKRFEDNSSVFIVPWRSYQKINRECPTNK